MPKLHLATLIVISLWQEIQYSQKPYLSMKVLNLPLATEPTLRATCVSDKKGTHQLVATQRDCLEERIYFASTWFLYRVFIVKDDSALNFQLTLLSNMMKLRGKY